jgi:hypothetical protein
LQRCIKSRPINFDEWNKKFNAIYLW